MLQEYLPILMFLGAAAGIGLVLLGLGFAIGSGGNINKTFRLANCKTGKPLSYNKIKEVRLFLKDFSVSQRVMKLALRPDRADVIVPALRIYLKVMK